MELYSFFHDGVCPASGDADALGASATLSDVVFSLALGAIGARATASPSPAFEGCYCYNNNTTVPQRPQYSYLEFRGYSDHSTKTGQ